MARWHLIQNATRVLDTTHALDLRGVDLWIRNGTLIDVIASGSDAPALLKPDDELHIVDAHGLLVTPRFMDIHVHFREPGNEDAETLATGRRAGLRGGYGCVFTMANTTPVCDEPGLVERTVNAPMGDDPCDVVPVSALSRGLRGSELVDLEAMAAAGAGAFSDDGTWLADRMLARQAFQWAAKNNVLIMQHCEDFEVTGPGVLHACSCTHTADIPGIDRRAEDKAVAADIALAEETHAAFHVCHISTEGAVKALRAGRERGLSVTGEVTPHHLLLTADDAVAGGVDFKMKPPLRESNDVDALIDALQDGTIEAIATDHAPHTDASKAGGLLRAPFGAIGLETAFPSLYTGLVKTGRLDLERLVSGLTTGPARIVGRDVPLIAVGEAFDANLIDLEHEEAVDRDLLASRSKNCPFHGLTLIGWPVASFCRAQLLVHRPRINERIRTYHNANERLEGDSGPPKTT